MTTLNPVFYPRLRQRLSKRAAEHNLVQTRLHCRCCSRVHIIALPADAVLSKLLAEMTCPTCKVTGTLSVVTEGDPCT